MNRNLTWEDHIAITIQENEEGYYNGQIKIIHDSIGYHEIPLQLKTKNKDILINYGQSVILAIKGVEIEDVKIIEKVYDHG